MNHQSITLRIHNDDIKRLAKAKFGFITARHMSKYTNAVEKLMNYFDEKELEDAEINPLSDLLAVFEEAIEELKTLEPIIKN
tara:strand:+ start:974 stop:1219 length:246 start_codon:yes stop_codon:yes gene_type:complete